MFNFGWLKRYMPRTLFARALLILFVPVFGIQAVTALVVLTRHIEGVTQQMTASVASELYYTVRLIEDGDTTPDDALNDISGLLGLSLLLDPDGTLPPRNILRGFDVSGQTVYETLRDRIKRPVRVDMSAINKVVLVYMNTEVGLLTAVVPRNRMVASNPHLLLTWTIFASLILVTISVLFLRNQIRPIRELARVSEAFGKGRSEPFRPRGADEVRRAGGAFLAMRNRIERQIEQRTMMLSGVSHDLRTPLTRMRLALAVAEPSTEIDELDHDVAQMERMLDGFLAFARGEGTEETQQIDPSDIGHDIVQSARRNGAQISLLIENSTPQNCLVSLREMAMHRAVQNLISNACRYGDKVRLTVVLTAHRLEFRVEDNGPGINEAHFDDALKPFSRLDAARNQDNGGSVGLGLSIAADVARSHGGSLRLARSAQLGGLSAVIQIPR